ncbi:MAG: flagellin, partial [Defluviitaleaceae bacterium]|nr:flagellin [Defluviitaleaceae bacterium]
MVVRTNVMALNSHRNLGNVARQQANASGRLSSGFRINSAADDAAGLAISEGMRSQIRGMNQAARNAQDGISLIQTAEGYTNTLTELMQRARQLMVQGANDTNSAAQRTHISNELTQISRESARIWNESTFNGQRVFGAGNLLNGSFNLQVGADGIAGMRIDAVVEIGTTRITDAGTAATTATNFVPATADHAGFQGTIVTMDTAINNMSALRAGLGALQNRLEFTIDNLNVASENLSAAESRIRDADMAQEMMRLTQANVLQQAATAMLAQANQAPQSVLQL